MDCWLRRATTRSGFPPSRRRASRARHNPPSPLHTARSARYRSSMVNSGACSAPRSRLRNTGAKAKIFVLAGRQQLLASDLWRGVQIESRRPRSGPISSVGMRAVALRCRAKPAGTPAPPRRIPALEPAAQRRLDAGASGEERPAVGVNFGVHQGRSVLMPLCRPSRPPSVTRQPPGIA